MGTVNLLEMARRIPSLRAIIVITSDKCYSNSILDIRFVKMILLAGPLQCVKSFNWVSYAAILEIPMISGLGQKSQLHEQEMWSVAALVKWKINTWLGSSNYRKKNLSSPQSRLNPSMAACFRMASSYVFKHCWKDLLGEKPRRSLEFRARKHINQSMKSQKKWLGIGRRWDFYKLRKGHLSEATVLKLDISKAKEKLAFVPKMSRPSDFINC